MTVIVTSFLLESTGTTVALFGVSKRCSDSLELLLKQGHSSNIVIEERQERSCGVGKETVS